MLMVALMQRVKALRSITAGFAPQLHEVSEGEAARWTGLETLGSFTPNSFHPTEK